VIGTANQGFAQYALEEIRRLFPDLKFQYLESGEIFWFKTATLREDLLHRLRENEPIFLRHVQPVDHELVITRTLQDLTALQALASSETRFQKGEKVAIQVRKQSGIDFAYTPVQLKAALSIEQFGVISVAREADWILSIYLSAEKLYWGISRPVENLSDWSGGAVRFQKEAAQISRAKFKLLEAESAFAIDFRQFQNALDIGAAPGGWTEFLLERGLRVTAVDPGKLDAALLKNPRLTYLPRNAENIDFPAQSFDLLVCDMNGSPNQTAKLIAKLLPMLKVEGILLLTIKLMHKKPFQTVKETLVTLGNRVVLVRAKQLFHNREELTLYLKVN
jgi:23S rRNA (cytidine2498-2'-O)-methyltransferase